MVHPITITSSGLSVTCLLALGRLVSWLSGRLEFLKSIKTLKNSVFVLDLSVTFMPAGQRYIFRVLQTIQMKLLCVWAEQAAMGSAKTA